jgi:hypothetical protein
MSESDRVLSGSITKGTRATLTGSMQYFYQGVNARTTVSYFGSLLPRIGSGDRTELYYEGSPVSSVTYDDSISINNNIEDLRSESTPKIEERIGFEYENRNLGQSNEIIHEDPFIESDRLDPVGILIFDSDFGVLNVKRIEDFLFDAVLEPLDARKRALGLIDSYSGHDVRGSLVGASSERPWGSKEIRYSWDSTSVVQEYPFLDAPDSFDMTSHDNVPAPPAYQDIQQKHDYPFVEKEYHNTVYAPVFVHNDASMINALKLLNSSSCEGITNPFEKRGATGTHYDQKAGSISYIDVFVVGELE